MGWKDAPEVHDWEAAPENAPPATSGVPDWVRSAGGALYGAGEGIAKTAAQVPSVGIPGLPAWAGGPTPTVTELDPNVGKWAESKDPEHPYSEPAGRLIANVAPYALTEGVGPEVAGMSLLPRLGVRAAEGLVKGGIGATATGSNATQRETGSAAGAGANVAREALKTGVRAIPGGPQAKALLAAGAAVPAYYGLEDLAHQAFGGRLPWFAAHHMITPLMALAGWLAGRPTAAGAAGAEAEKLYEQQ
jgi:hypothetical protein